MDFPFKSDGCSVVADYDQRACCVRHDWHYWKGGTWRDRLKADNEFARCIWKTSRWWFLAPVRWLGVRVGASPWFPLSWTRLADGWRWGFGWRDGKARPMLKGDGAKWLFGPYTEANQAQALVRALRGKS